MTTSLTTYHSNSGFSVQDPRVQISPVGLVLHGEITFDEWSQLGPNLALLERSLRWSLADWLNYGETRYGEMYAQALNETGFEYGYLANLSYLARKVDISLRREELGLSHHMVVASMPPDLQEAWLQYAVDNRLSRAEFREAVRLASMPDSEDDPATATINEAAPISHDKLMALVLSMIRAKKAGKSEIFDIVLCELMEVLEPWI